MIRKWEPVFGKDRAQMSRSHGSAGITLAARCSCDAILRLPRSNKIRPSGGYDMRITSRVLAAAALAAGFAAASVSAQAQNVRVRGTIEKLDGNTLMVKSRDGADLKLALKDNVRIGGVVKASLGDLKARTNVAVT